MILLCGVVACILCLVLIIIGAAIVNGKCADTYLKRLTHNTLVSNKKEE